MLPHVNVSPHLHVARQPLGQEQVLQEGRSELEVGREDLLQVVAGLGSLQQAGQLVLGHFLKALLGQLHGVALPDQELVLALDAGSRGQRNKMLGFRFQ